MSDRKEKGGDWTEKASYPYANMQIRALLGSLHIIEVRRLSVESMDNITFPTLQDVMNRRNIIKMWFKLTLAHTHSGMCRNVCVKSMLGPVQYVCVYV